MRLLGKLLPWTIFALGFVSIGMAALKPSYPRTPFNLKAYAAIPVNEGGRVKPIDTVARVSLKIINGGFEQFTDEKEVTQPAIQWMLDAMTSETMSHEAALKEASDRRVFEIEDQRILEELGLTKRSDSMYSYNEIEAVIPKIATTARRASTTSTPDTLDLRYAELGRQVVAFKQMVPLQGPSFRHRVFRIENDAVLSFLGLEASSKLRYCLNDFKDRIPSLYARAVRAQRMQSKDAFDTKVLELVSHLNVFFTIAYLENPAVVMPMAPSENWTTLGNYLSEMSEGKAKLFSIAQDKLVEQADKSDAEFAKMFGPMVSELADNNADGLIVAAYQQLLLDAYQHNQPELFNKLLERLPALLTTTHQTDNASGNFELFFNHFAPFYNAIFLYLSVFIVALFSLLFWAFPVDRESPLAGLLATSNGIRESSSLTRAAFLLAILTLLLHTWAIFARMYIQGRPPVTNLYSSAVFIGWGCMCVCLFLEWLFQNGLSVLIGSALGAITLYVAHLLSVSGDTISILEPVLDTNFWLATHVTCVTFGYTATFISGFIGIVYIVLGLTTKLLDRQIATAVGKMMYGVVCFAMLLSFTGTVLGGIWADQSWGRFWGWDPKENGALLIVIWNALILHARWGGLVKSRGIAVLAVGGNIVTSWSWFGTNLLGVGKHSYGFMEGAKETLIAWVVLNLLVMAIGCLPLRLWRSFAPPSAKREKEPALPTAPMGFGDSMA